MWREDSIGDISEAYDAAQMLTVGPVTQFAYACRGQSNVDWTLNPSFLRSLESDLTAKDAIGLERRALREFQTEASLHLEATHVPPYVVEEALRWWVLMQHHGAPTRLVDWTFSFWVALYFAVVDNWDVDGAVWYFSSGNLSQRIPEGHPLGDPTKMRALQQYADPAAQSVLQVVVLPHTKTQRAAAQQGTFTVSTQVLDDHADAIPGQLGGHVSEGQVLAGKFVVSRESKPEILRHLRSMNITAKVLFPGADGLSRSVKELVQLSSTSKFIAEHVLHPPTQTTPSP